MPDFGRFRPFRASDQNAAADRVHQWWFRFDNGLGLSVMEFPQRPGVFDVLPTLEAPERHWGDEQSHLPLSDVLMILEAIEQLEEPGELPWLEPEPATWY